MTEKELYQQKLHAEMDAWKAQLALLQARAASAGADAQLALKKQAGELELAMQHAGKQLAELTSAGDEAWDSARKSLEGTWESLGDAWRKEMKKHGN